MSSSIRRREFLRVATGAIAGAAGIAGLPTILTAKKTESPLILGEGEHKYEVIHDWPQLPDQFTWQTTHNVAFDKAGNLYVIHEGHKDKKDHPAIFVFDADGKYMRSFGQDFQGGGHGLEVHEENGEEFLYVTGYQAIKKFAKLTLAGKPIWERHAPMESGIYAKDEDSHPTGAWGRDRFMPTNIAFRPDSTDFYVADGYGAWVVHVYDREANYKSTFGKPGPGKEDGQFDTPHGIWIDRRKGRERTVVVADRANGRLQWFTLDGKHRETLDGFMFPANVDTFGELMLVPELQARVTLLDGKNKVVAQFGNDAAWGTAVMKREVRKDRAQWPNGKFIHPHDACFDAHGNIFVCEWVATGRVSKLRKVS
jgi:DNA-binding beta-propeller fold protein YncE